MHLFEEVSLKQNPLFKDSPFATRSVPYVRKTLQFPFEIERVVQIEVIIP